MLEPQSLAVTRALGDFYMHTFGVTWKPEVVSVDLRAKAADLSALTLVLASDGVWDLWDTPDAFRMLARVPKGATIAGSPPTSQALAFFKACVAKGDEMFGTMADNLTGIVVYLHPKDAAASAAASAPATTAPAAPTTAPATPKPCLELSTPAVPAAPPKPLMAQPVAAAPAPPPTIEDEEEDFGA